MTDLHVHSNVDQVLKYEWRGELKRCPWSLGATGRFQIETQGQDALESAEIDRYLQAELERGNI
jgi:hypothetical protein